MAVKVIKMDKSNPDQFESLVNEVRVLTSVEHPNIVSYFYCKPSEDKSELLIFMEFCKGGSLNTVIINNPKMDLEEVSAILQQIVSALAYLHEKGIAHRDIKPANVLISNGKMKLADFGTATSIKAASAGVKEVAGTMQYMAPEVFAEEEPYGLPCDIWSVGILCLDLLHYQPPILKKRMDLISLAGCRTDDEIFDGFSLDPSVMSFLKACLTVEPKNRLTASALLDHPFLTEVRKTYGLDNKRVSLVPPGGLARFNAASDDLDNNNNLSVCSTDFDVVANDSDNLVEMVSASMFAHRPSLGGVGVKSLNPDLLSGASVAVTAETGQTTNLWRSKFATENADYNPVSRRRPTRQSHGTNLVSPSTTNKKKRTTRLDSLTNIPKVESQPTSGEGGGDPEPQQLKKESSRDNPWNGVAAAGPLARSNSVLSDL